MELERPGRDSNTVLTQETRRTTARASGAWAGPRGWKGLESRKVPQRGMTHGEERLELGCGAADSDATRTRRGVPAEGGACGAGRCRTGGGAWPTARKPASGSSPTPPRPPSPSPRPRRPAPAGPGPQVGGKNRRMKEAATSAASVSGQPRALCPSHWLGPSHWQRRVRVIGSCVSESLAAACSPAGW